MSNRENYIKELKLQSELANEVGGSITKYLIAIIENMSDEMYDNEYVPYMNNIFKDGSNGIYVQNV